MYVWDEKVYQPKKIDKEFETEWYDRLLIIDKKIMSIINLDENE